MSEHTSTFTSSHFSEKTLDNLMEGFQLIDFEWRYLYVNKAVIKQSKCKSAKELLGFTMMEKFPGIENSKLFKKLEKCMITRTSGSLQNKFEYPDGTTEWFELRIRPVPKGLFILSSNITKQKLAEERLRKANERLEEEVESRTAKLIEKNREITDSIRYAQRIQQAMLPSDDEMKKYFPQSFLLYKPKDIVSGDFYWLMPTDDGVLFAVADCTGHGVPGAMVSIVCSNALNKAVNDFGFTNPSKILDKTAEIVTKEFGNNQKGVHIKDGMDIALCKINGNEIQFAGANNPLWVINNMELTEIKGDRQAIGEADNRVPYTTHTINVKKGDHIYLSTDGFADQFGGPNGKKLKALAFRNKLIHNSDKPMYWQKHLLDETITNWQGDLEQVDDILVAGIKID